MKMTQEFTLKRIEEYTEEELLALTEEQQTMIIDLECAHEGIQLLPDEPTAMVRPDNVGEDLTVYSLPAIYFTKHSDAKDIVDVINERMMLGSYGELKYVNYLSLKYKFVPATKEMTIDRISSEKIFSEERIKRAGDLIERYEAAQKEYKVEKEIYDRIAGQHKAITSALHTRISDAYAKKRKMLRLKAEARRYMELANGNIDIAKNFMVNAYSEEEINICKNFYQWVDDLAVETNAVETKLRQS